MNDCCDFNRPHFTQRPFAPASPKSSTSSLSFPFVGWSFRSVLFPFLHYIVSILLLSPSCPSPLSSTQLRITSHLPTSLTFGVHSLLSSLPTSISTYPPSFYHPTLSLSTLASSTRQSPAADESHLAALVEIVSPGDVLFDPNRTTTTIVTSIPSTTTTSPAEGTATYGSDRYRDDDDDDISDDDDIAGSTSSYLANAYRKPAVPQTSTFGLPSQPPAVPHFRTYPTTTGVEEYTAETKAKDAKMDGKRQLNSFQQLEKLGEGTYATVCPLFLTLRPSLRLIMLTHLPGL